MSLKQWIARRNETNPIAIERMKIYKWLKEICKGIRYLHGTGDRGFIHRDIKPDNILLSQDNTIKITDLGLATDNPFGTLTADIGTQLYKPEEQFGSIYDQRVDIYPVGERRSYKLLINPIISMSFYIIYIYIRYKVCFNMLQELFYLRCYQLSK